MHITPAHTSTDSNDRRRHERTWTVRACRIRGANRVRAEVGETTNVSESGALLRLGTGGVFAVGEEVDVVVSWDGAGLVRSEEAVRCVVRRVVPMDYHHQAVAVEYMAASGAQRLPVAGATRLAA